MPIETTLDLSDCTEYRQALRAHAPRSIHATAILLIALLAAAVSWAALTRANLVVTGEGRVRPISDPQTHADDFSREISSQREGRVVQVTVDVGEQVDAGAVLVRLDTAELDIQIDKLEQTIQAGKERLKQIDRSDDLLTRRFEAARAKAQAELDDMATELNVAKLSQAADIRLAGIALDGARDIARRCERLAACDAATREELVKATAQVKQAEEELRKAQIPLNEQKVDVPRRSIELICQEHQEERQKLAVERKTKQHEIDAAAFDLEKLRLEHRQSVIRAPEPCIITKADVKLGDIVKPGKIGITTARQQGFEFEVEVPNADVALLRDGMPVQIKLDAYDHHKYGVLPGTVRLVAPDSTLKQIGEGRQAAVYQVKVALSADAVGRGENRSQIKLGMTGRAEIVTDRERILAILVRKIRQRITLT